MGFAGARQAAFEHAGDLEDGNVILSAAGAVGLDGFLAERLTATLG